MKQIERKYSNVSVMVLRPDEVALTKTKMISIPAIKNALK
jgi:hypothetical protein